MGIFEDFLYKVKSDKGLKFDSEVADLIGIDRRSLASAKVRGVLPIKYIKWYCDLYSIERTEFEGHLKGSGTETESEENVDYTIIAQRETIELQREIIENLKKQLTSSKKIYSKPAYHFKIVGKYIQKTNTWLDAQIYGDISMLGFSHDELNDILSVKGNNPNSWIERYHPDSYEKLHESEYWKKTKSNFHHCSWEHMMWRSKSGQYVCLNIDMMYDKKEESVTTLFYYVNGDNE